MNPRLLAGAVIGVVLGAVLGGVAHLVMKTKRRVDAQRGWNLSVVVVTTRALPPGTVLGMDDVSQRSIPEQFVTASVVKPSEVSMVLNQPLRFGLENGEPLRWSDFETAGQKTAKQLFAEEVTRKTCAAELAARGLQPKSMTPADVKKSLEAP